MLIHLINVLKAINVEKFHKNAFKVKFVKKMQNKNYIKNIICIN